MIESIIQSLSKIVLFILVTAILLGVCCTSAVFLSKASCSESDNLCAPFINGNNNPNYRQEWFACWKKCAPKNLRLNAKTCECSCFEELSL